MQAIMDAMDAQRFDISKSTKHLDVLGPDGLAKPVEAYRNETEEIHGDVDCGEDGDGATLYHDIQENVDNDAEKKNHNILVDIAKVLKRSCKHVIPSLPVCGANGYCNATASANASRTDVSTIHNQERDKEKSEANHDELKEEAREKETDTLLNVSAVLLSEKKHEDNSTIPRLPPVCNGVRETKAGVEITDVFDREEYIAVRTILRPRPSFFNRPRFRTGSNATVFISSEANRNKTDAGDAAHPQTFSAPTSPTRIGFHFASSFNCLSTDAFEEQVNAIQAERAREMRGENIQILCEEQTMAVAEENVPVPAPLVVAAAA